MWLVLPLTRDLPAPLSRPLVVPFSWLWLQMALPPCQGLGRIQNTLNCVVLRQGLLPHFVQAWLAHPLTENPLAPPNVLTVALSAEIKLWAESAQTESYGSGRGEIFFPSQTSADPSLHMAKSWSLWAWQTLLVSPWWLPETMIPYKDVRTASSWQLDAVYPGTFAKWP